MTKRDRRNQLWTLSNAERARVLLEGVRNRNVFEHVNRARVAKFPTGYARAVDALNDSDPLLVQHGTGATLTVQHVRDSINSETHW